MVGWRSPPKLWNFLKFLSKAMYKIYDFFNKFYWKFSFFLLSSLALHLCIILQKNFGGGLKPRNQSILATRLYGQVKKQIKLSNNFLQFENFLKIFYNNSFWKYHIILYSGVASILWFGGLSLSPSRNLIEVLYIGAKPRKRGGKNENFQ